MPGITIALCAQALLSFSVEGQGPVRFGFPVPETAVVRGLRLSGDPGARMQWSALQTVPGLGAGRLWVEVAIVGHTGGGRLMAGGDPPVPREGGEVVRVVVAVERDDEQQRHRVEWRWCDGTVDRSERIVYLVDDGVHEAGEASFQVSPDLLARRTRVRIARSAWRRAGVLPPADGSGRSWRRDLLDAIPHLPRASGERGRGDFVRGPEAGIVTNLEFDTTLGLIRLGLCEDEAGLLLRAWECARHLVDIDVDRRSGLPHRHGTGHRTARPELGHVWIEGLMLVACTFADRGLIEEALTMARALSSAIRTRQAPTGRYDRMRDEAWPLHELEGILRFVDLPPIRAGADAAAAAMLERWNGRLASFRYGEAETRNPEVVRDRIWLSAGIALPALRRYAERTRDARVVDIVAQVERRAAAVLLAGRRGVAIQAVVGPSGPFDAVRVEGAAESFLLLDGLGDRLRRRALGRAGIRDALAGALDRGHDDLATRFSLIARCAWILR